MTQVQIYMLEENKELIYDNDQLTEFNALVSELGLQCNNVKDDEKSPIPYMWLDEATLRAFKILCPKIDPIKDYRFEIPLEVLRNVKLSETEKYFDWIEVWSNSKDPDPFAIGRVYKTPNDRDKKYTWNASHYLIGRWGAENKEINELIEMAVKIASSKIKNFAETGMAKLKSWNECPDVWAKNYIFNNNQETQTAIQSSQGSVTDLPF